MINPRVTRLLRTEGFRGVQRTILSVLPGGLEARRVAIIVPTRSAAEELRRTIEGALLRGDSASPAVVLPDIITRRELYIRLYGKLPDAPPLLNDFEREVLLRLAAEDAQQSGADSPFRLRPGLLAAIATFYDELRRRGRTIDTFDRILRNHLEPGSDSDRGAARLLQQMHFLAATFASFERRVAGSGRLDEHALRTLLLGSEHAPAYRHVIICVADQAGDPGGLWPADFDLLARLPGLERLDVVATERMLATGWHQRLHDVLPGIVEERLAGAEDPPVLHAPALDPARESSWHFLCRDREEELVDAARWVKDRARAGRGTDEPPALHRTAIVFQRPLPYLYLAGHLLEACQVPYQTVDSLPLAAEPFAAALDLLFTALVEEVSRSSLIELLGSSQWVFTDPATADRPLARSEVTALDRLLRDAKFLGGGDRLRQFASEVEGGPRPQTRVAARWQLAGPALASAVAVSSELQSIATAPTASEQLAALIAFVKRHERVSREGEPGHERHIRARGAILGALAALRDAHARFDDRPLPLGELVPSIRRWIEGQTFTPRAGTDGLLLLDVSAAAFAEVDAVRLVGLVEVDWPERTSSSIFFPVSILRDLGWPPESDRLSAARARFHDLLHLPDQELSVSSFTLEDDALVSPSPFLDDLGLAGLPVDRTGARSAARVFAHEALYQEPVSSDALSSAAKEWLDLRRTRTSLLDPRYHGRTGPRAPELYAVSRVERYLACPFKYLAGHLLQLEEERDDESGLTPQERGQLLHGVFEAFFRAWRARRGGAITIESLGDAITLFAEVAESKLQAVPEGDRALERTYLLGSAASPGLAERAFAFEIEHGVGVIERFVEYPIEGLFQFEGPEGPRDVRLRGLADRIDLLADGTLRVVDYKLGRAPKPGRVLQLPIYGVCAEQQLKGYLGRQWRLGRAGYVAFREKNAFVELGGRSGKLEDVLREGEHRFVHAVEQIERGVFPPTPDEPWTCSRCGFPQVCRKDYVGDE